MNHRQLVEIAYRWVLKNGSCGFAFMELKSLSREIPDVIAFSSWHSVVIECKVSRSDFLKDQKKACREEGMGEFRLYCCPTGLIRKADLPDKWGLIWVGKNNKGVCVVNPMRSDWIWNDPNDHSKGLSGKKEMSFDIDHEEERKVMYTALRRIFKRGLMDCIYDQAHGRKKNSDELIKLNF
jgi:hypothetical protein